MTSKKIAPLEKKIETITQAPQPLEKTTPMRAESVLKTLLIPCSVIIAGGLIGLSIFLSSVYNARSSTAAATLPAQNDPGQIAGQREEADYQALAKNVAAVTDADHIRGPKDAKVVIVEYSDIDCPFCKQVHPILQKLQGDYQGQVSWVYRHFPLSAIHPTAEHKAQASECVAELAGNDGFWKFIDSLFSEAAATDGQLATIAAKSGANKAAFQQCLDSGRYKDKVAGQLQNGTKSGVAGTPHTILIANGNYKAIRGALPEQSFKAEIDALLGK